MQHMYDYGFSAACPSGGHTTEGVDRQVQDFVHVVAKQQLSLWFGPDAASRVQARRNFHPVAEWHHFASLSICITWSGDVKQKGRNVSYDLWILP